MSDDYDAIHDALWTIGERAKVLDVRVAELTKENERLSSQSENRNLVAQELARDSNDKAVEIMHLKAAWSRLEVAHNDALIELSAKDERVRKMEAVIDAARYTNELDHEGDYFCACVMRDLPRCRLQSALDALESK